MDNRALHDCRLRNNVNESVPDQAGRPAGKTRGRGSEPLPATRSPNAYSASHLHRERNSVPESVAATQTAKPRRARSSRTFSYCARSSTTCGERLPCCTCGKAEAHPADFLLTNRNGARSRASIFIKCAHSKNGP
eukprot:3950857-Pleurochrysis_carterae.AAC.1